MSLEDVVLTLRKVKATRSRTEKAIFLRNCKDRPLLEQILRSAYDWRTTYGLALDAYADKGAGGEMQDAATVLASDEGVLTEFFLTLEKLRQRTLVGLEAREKVAKLLSQASVPLRQLLKGIINRHLDIGVSGKTIVANFPGLITLFGVQLCQPFDPEKGLPNGPGWFAEPKLDGVRCLIGRHDGKLWTALSREGNELYNLGHLIEALQELPNADSFIFDGEVRGANFHETVGAVHSSVGGSGTKLDYYLFDCIAQESFPNESETYTERRRRLFDLIRDSHSEHLKLTTALPVHSLDSASTAFAQFLTEGYEGTVLKRIDSSYRGERTQTWLKWKPRATIEGWIQGFEEGTGKHQGRLGAIVCDFEGTPSKVGSGFTDADRQELWANREHLLGKVLEAYYQEKTPTGALRFPVFARLREDRKSV